MIRKCNTFTVSVEAEILTPKKENTMKEDSEITQ